MRIDPVEQAAPHPAGAIAVQPSTGTRRGAAVLDALPWRNAFASLPPVFYTRLDPTALPDPELIDVSDEVATLIGLDPDRLDREVLRDQLAGARAIAGSAPLASVYAGHQFGVYVPQLGDGRALLLGGVETPAGELWELQLKGSGRTPYSRMADGRAVLRSTIREYLCSEAMAGLGIPTTRALGLVGSEQPVIRETVETAAIVMRAARSFIRFGHFEFFYHRRMHDALRRLADFTIDTQFPACRAAANPYLGLLEEVARRTARLVAHWQAVGFCHGVMNTDNLSVLGLTIDYGPFGFIDAFDAGHVCNHSDETGRYAYDRQPQVAYWNLHCLGQALVPLTVDVDATRAALQIFEDEFAASIDERFHAKLGLATRHERDEALIERLLGLLHQDRVDWTIFWRRLCAWQSDAAGDTGANAAVRDLFIDRAAFDTWAGDYTDRLRAESSVDTERVGRMKGVNPKFVLRNHLAEVAIRAARGDEGPRDFAPLRRLLQVLRRPYDEQPDAQPYAAPPPAWAATLHLSCSS